MNLPLPEPLRAEVDAAYRKRTPLSFHDESQLRQYCSAEQVARFNTYLNQSYGLALLAPPPPLLLPPGLPLTTMVYLREVARTLYLHHKTLRGLFHAVDMQRVARRLPPADAKALVQSRSQAYALPAFSVEPPGDVTDAQVRLYGLHLKQVVQRKKRAEMRTVALEEMMRIANVGVLRDAVDLELVAALEAQERRTA